MIIYIKEVFSMNFAEKLDLLMNVTNTNNSQLARSIAIDASAISRLRRGIRTPAKGASYFRPMARYFAHNCRSEYQKFAIDEAIKLDNPSLAKDKNKGLESILYIWLSDTNKTTKDSLDDFMQDFINFKFRKMDSLETVNIEDTIDYPLTEAGVFLGKTGKQKAVEHFLSLVLKSSLAETLLLYSDEDIEWLTEPDFVLKWASLMMQVITKGNRIKIIHSITRNLDEMIKGIKEWLPLYMTGAIEPFYYPKTQDGIFKHTFFIAPETAAVISSSVRDNTKNTANFLHTDKKTVSALATEYLDFLSLCRPLMHIFTINNYQNGYLNLLEEFENEAGDVIIKVDSLSDITMPALVAENILTRIKHIDISSLTKYHLKRIANFKKSLANDNYTEIITLPPLKNIWAGNIPIELSDILHSSPIYYHSEEYLAHLKNIIELLNTYPNYNVVIAPENQNAGSLIYVKEDVGVLIGKNNPPAILFAINETNMTAAFWDYINILINRTTIKEPSRDQTIARLEKLANTLESKL